MGSILYTLRAWIAWVLAVVHNAIDPTEEPYDGIEFLRSEFQSYEEGEWEASATVRTEAAQFLGFLAVCMMGDEENFCASTLEMTVPSGKDRYDIQVERVGGKTVAEEIAELRARLEGYREGAQAQLLCAKAMFSACTDTELDWREIPTRGKASWFEEAGLFLDNETP